MVDVRDKTNISTSREPISLCEIGFAFVISSLFAFYIWQLYQPAHLLQLRSDQHNIASFAAAQEHPERYGNDILLSDPANYQWYTPLYVAAVKYISRLTGSYAATFVGLIIPTVTLFLAGTYFLLRYLTCSRLLSVGLAFLFTIVLIPIPLGGNWTIIDAGHMRPNTQFTALLPWILLFGIWSRRHVIFWPLVGACSAFLIYVHPVSAPAWGFAIFGGLLWSSKEYCGVKARLLWLLMLVITAALIVVPYFVIYLGIYFGKQVPPDQFDTTYEFAAQRFIPGTLDLGLALKRFFLFAWGSKMRLFTCFLLVWAIAGQAFAWLDNGEARTKARFLASGLVFFLLVTVGATFVDQLIASRMKRLPFQTDLIRGLKFWPWWLLLLGAPGFPGLRRAIFGSNLCPRYLARNLTVLILCFAFFASYSLIAKHRKRILDKTKANAAFVEEMETTNELVHFIERNLPTNATFYGKCWPIWLRHTPGRAVALTWKDSGAMLFSNSGNVQKFLDRWYSQQSADTFAGIEELCRQWGADYILLENPHSHTYDAERIVFSNSHWTLVCVNSPPQVP